MMLKAGSGLGSARQGTAKSTLAQCLNVVPRAVHGQDMSSQTRISPVSTCNPTSAAPISRSAQRRQRMPVQAVVMQSDRANTGDGFKRGSHWQVHKFGGTCMAAAERIKAVAELMIKENNQGTVVVVSAMGSHPSSPLKVTDVILNMIQKAAKQDQAFLLDLAALQDKHVETAKALLGQTPELTSFVSRLLDDMANLKAMLQAMSIAGMSTEAFADYVVGHGELWSAQLLTLCCQQLGADAVFMDTRDVLVVVPTSDGTSVDLVEDVSNARMDDWFKRNGNHKIVVATGFIAKNKEGQATTLKRNGSDFSATIMGSLFKAGHITIWTDVDGVYSADPRKVPEAVCLPSMTYHEAWELSYFGANVLHPRTTLPAMKYHIPITIRNFFNLPSKGTVVSDFESDQAVYQGKNTVKGLATIDHTTLINVEGTGMVGVPGIASAIFSTVRDAGINVIMISQASSEQSICFAVKAADGDAAVRVLQRRFADAIASGRVSAVQAIPNCCVLAVVGQGMVSKRGVAATLFSALAKANVNIKAMAQGSSEYNITVLIDQVDSERALRAVHSRFYLSSTPIGIGLVGPGLIGGALLDQLREQAETLRAEFAIDLRILGISTSKQMVLSEKGVDMSRWRDEFKEKGQPVDLAKFGDHLANSYIPNRAIVDCTASDAPAQMYLPWMKQGIHIITPNKKLGSGPLELYNQVKKVGRESYIHFFYEGTVGAGLPVMGTLKHLVETGDKVQRIEGIFSGTLSYIFNTWGSDARKFSEIVSDAKAKGFTEPDPRDDLNGTDVARKVAILARECGLQLELSDIPVESLVPEPLRAIPDSATYMARLPEFDGDMAARLKEAQDAGEVLRFVGVVDVAGGKGSVELRRYPKTHPFAQLSGSDNIIAFTTKRYTKQPLIVRGPGAGADVTAGGVFSDLLKLAAYLGAPS